MKYKERPVVVYFESVNNIKVYKTVKSAMAETSEYNYQQLAKRLRETKIVPVDNGFLKMVDVLWGTGAYFQESEGSTLQRKGCDGKTYSIASGIHSGEEFSITIGQTQ